MNVLITYDISARHGEVKKRMKTKKYHDFWKSMDKLYYLPNTNLWKDVTTAEIAIEDLKAVIESINSEISLQKDKIRLERCISVEFEKWDGIPHSRRSSCGNFKLMKKICA